MADQGFGLCRNLKMIHGVLLLPALPHGLSIEVEFHRSQGLKEGTDDVLIGRISGQTLTNRHLGLRPEFMAQLLSAPLLWHDHLMPTAAAGHDSLEHGRPWSGHAAGAMALIHGIVVVQDRRSPPQGLPRDGGRIAVVPHDIPLGVRPPDLVRPYPTGPRLRAGVAVQGYLERIAIGLVAIGA
jgi:hypothetical protein